MTLLELLEKAKMALLDSLFGTRAPGDKTAEPSSLHYHCKGDDLVACQHGCESLTGDLHYHPTAIGLVACWHKCKSCLTDLSFWIGVTVSFPLEHVIWEKSPPFNYIARYFGLL